jgi:hypothetical protein
VIARHSEISDASPRSDGLANTRIGGRQAHEQARGEETCAAIRECLAQVGPQRGMASRCATTRRRAPVLVGTAYEALGGNWGLRRPRKGKFG